MWRSSVCSLQSGNCRRQRRRAGWSRSMCSGVAQRPAACSRCRRERSTTIGQSKLLPLKVTTTASSLEPLPQAREHRGLFGVVAGQQQFDGEPAVDPSQQPDEKQGAAGKAARFEIEQDGAVGKRVDERNQSSCCSPAARGDRSCSAACWLSASPPGHSSSNGRQIRRCSPALVGHRFAAADQPGNGLHHAWSHAARGSARRASSAALHAIAGAAARAMPPSARQRLAIERFESAADGVAGIIATDRSLSTQAAELANVPQFLLQPALHQRPQRE